MTRLDPRAALRRRSGQLGPRQRTLVLGCLALLGLGLSANAAHQAYEGWDYADLPPALRTTSDPEIFIQGLAPSLPMPVVLLTREDAVAQELLANSRTMNAVQALRTAQALCEEARTAGYDPLLFLAVIHIESLYNHLALSPVGAEGLMQLMPETAEFLAARGKVAWPDNHSFDPVLNVRLGVRYLVELDRMFHGMDLALTAYNRGPHNTRIILQRFGRMPDAVRDFYATKVLARQQLLERAYGKLPWG